MGEKVAQSFFQYLTQATTQKLFDDFSTLNIEIYYPKINQTDLKFANKKFLITGSFEHFSRDELKKIINDQGGKILSAPSKNLHILCAGEKAGSKLKKVEELNKNIDQEIEIWDEKKIVQELNISQTKTEKEQESLF